MQNDLRTTQALMGHGDPGTTAGYVAWSSANAVAAVRGLPGADLVIDLRENAADSDLTPALPFPR